jgi:hypothetical protein
MRASKKLKDNSSKHCLVLLHTRDNFENKFETSALLKEVYLNTF